MKFLIVEDEIDLQQAIVKYLLHENHICEVASDYYEALEKLDLYIYDIVILDLNLKNGSGLDLLKMLKKQKTRAGVIIISANSSLDDKLKGLDLGADDYLTKPFHLAELNSRIKAILRRGVYGGNDTIIFNEIRLDTLSRTAYVNDSSITLTRKEYDLLLYFITNQNKVLSKNSIAEHLWGDDSDMLNNFDFVYVHVNNLRKKLTKVGSKYLRTAYGTGYKFMED
ncbi:MAG: response regulator transcription factor [Leeuwenhoekiella sp.]